MEELMQPGRLRARVLQVSERTASRVVAGLLSRDVLVSASPRAPLSISFPAKLAPYWLPGLFPEPPR